MADAEQADLLHIKTTSEFKQGELTIQRKEKKKSDHCWNINHCPGSGGGDVNDSCAPHSVLTVIRSDRGLEED